MHAGVSAGSQIAKNVMKLISIGTEALDTALSTHASFAEATMFIAFVICLVFFTPTILFCMSLSVMPFTTP